MRKKRIMIVGGRGSGKTSLANALNGCDEEAPRKTQDTIYGKNTIDVPSAYIENTWMYMHVLALAQDASCVLLIVDCSKHNELYSPGFARAFRCPVIGVISKVDISPENERICMKQMQNIGVKEPYFNVNAKDREGIEDLKKYMRKAGVPMCESKMKCC